MKIIRKSLRKFRFHIAISVAALCYLILKLDFVSETATPDLLETGILLVGATAFLFSIIFGVKDFLKFKREYQEQKETGIRKIPLWETVLYFMISVIMGVGISAFIGFYFL